MITKEIAKMIIDFSFLKSAKFIAVENYESKSTGEIANYVVNINFSYKNAVNKDIQTLKSITLKELENISLKKGIENGLIIEAKNKILASLENNQNNKTKSNQSKAQTNLYKPVTNAIKMNKETNELLIYAMAIQKNVTVKGEHKKSNSRPLTIAQNAIKKELNLSTSKYRQFIITPNQLKAVRSNGNIYEF